MKKVAIICHNNVEESEALLAHDLFSRANFKVELISIEEDLHVISSHNLNFICDKMLDEIIVDEIDLIYLAGGPGIKKAINNDKLLSLVSCCYQKNKLIAAICAAPDILAKINIVNENEFSCYPNCDNHKFANNQNITIQNNIFTAKALGSCFDLCFKLIKELSDQETVERIKQQIFY